MKNITIKFLSTLTFFTLIFFTSCQNKETKEEIVKEEVKKAPVARIATPAPSPSSTVKQKVGLTDVTLAYSRPSMKGRSIFGDLVPFDKIWRTGANARTKITFSTDVTIDGQTLEKGTYAIFTKPTKKNWEVYFYSEFKGNGTPKEWDDAKIVAKTTAQVVKMPMKIETFTATFDDLTNSSAVLGLLWEDVYVGVTFSVPTDAAVMASINEVMKGNPDANAYYSAAVYFKNESKDINKAVTWIDKAIEMTSDKPRFWMLRQQSLIHAKAGNKKAAIEAAKESLKLAEKAGNAGYIKMNKASLKEWGAM